METDCCYYLPPLVNTYFTHTYHLFVLATGQVDHGYRGRIRASSALPYPGLLKACSISQCGATAAQLLRLFAEWQVILRMRPAQRLTHPPLTKHREWASHCLLPWLQFIKHPSERLLWVFIDWLWNRVLAGDTPTLYLAMVTAWEVLSPKGSRGASRSALGARLLLCCHVALSSCRLLSEKSSKRPARWFQHAWHALPECHRFGIETGSASWFFDLLKWF